AADVDAFHELHLPAARILHIEIDVEDEVADLLNRSPRGPVRPRGDRRFLLAAVAILDRRTAKGFLPFGRDRDDLEFAGGIQLLGEELADHLEARRLFWLGRLERGVDQGESEKGHTG